MKTLLIILLLGLPFIPVSASFSPQELASRAEERAPLIRMQLEGKKAATFQISQARLLANPSLAIQSGALKTDGQTGGVMDVTLNQPLPWPGKRFAEINSSRILEKLAEVDLQESRLMVHHSVYLLALELAVLQELEKHNKERRHRFSLIQKFLNTRPMASPKQVIEKDLIETQIKLVETQMYELSSKRKSLQEQLGRLTGDVVHTVDANWAIPPLMTRKDLLQQLQAGTGYQKALKQEEFAKNRIRQAEYLAKPDIVVGLNYRQENTQPANHFYHLNLALVIPIIDHGQHSVEIEKANARREEAQKELVLQDGANKLEQFYHSLESAYQSTRLFTIRDLKRVEQRFGDAEDAFRKGRIDVTTFLQTDMQIHETIDTAYVSYLKYFTALSQINMLIGKRLDQR